MYFINNIADIKIDLDNEGIYVKYDSNIIGIDMIKMKYYYF